MDSAPSRMGLTLVASGYAAVVVISTALIYLRYLQYVRHPDDVAASSGMYAGGDLMLELFIGCMLLVPTAVLVFVIRNYEGAYTTYAKVLLALSITLPLSVGFISIPSIPRCLHLGMDLHVSDVRFTARAGGPRVQPSAGPLPPFPGAHLVRCSSRVPDADRHAGFADSEVACC